MINDTQRQVTRRIANELQSWVNATRANGYDVDIRVIKGRVYIVLHDGQEELAFEAEP